MQERTFFFTVVVPTYNRANLILNTLNSILNQKFKDFEVIVVDDGSTDHTKEVVKSINNDQLSYYFKENAERAAARNFGTDLAKGKYICWFDSDDIMLEDHLQVAFELIQKKKTPEIVVLSHNYADPDNNIISSVIHQEGYLREKLYKGNTISCNAIFVRKDIAIKNPFNEIRELSVSEDYELWMRLASKYEFHTSPEKTSNIILHDQRSMFTMTQSERLIQRFELFLRLIDENEDVKSFIGKKYTYFRMKNYLILSADLAASHHKRNALVYLRKSVISSPTAIFNKLFWATLKHLLL